MSAKASNLAILSDHGLPVPRGFILDASHYREAIQGVKDALIRARNNPAAACIVFESLNLPTRTRDAIDQGIQNLGFASAFAVRSSGDVTSSGRRFAEDSRSVSLAGQFDTFLNVPGKHIGEAVRKCWASLFNARSLELFQVDADYVAQSCMTVLIQEMIPAAASAVVMTVDPMGDGSTGAIELTLGPCEAIVSGSVNPDEVTFRRTTGQIDTVRVGDKLGIVRYNTFDGCSRNSFTESLPEAVRNRLSVSREIVTEIVRISARIERIFGLPQDIELAVDASDRVTVLQARPITRIPNNFSQFLAQNI